MLVKAINVLRSLVGFTWVASSIVVGLI